MRDHSYCILAGGVTDQDDNDANDTTALPSHKKRRVKVDLKVKVIPKKKSAKSEPPSKVPIVVLVYSQVYHAFFTYFITIYYNLTLYILFISYYPLRGKRNTLLKEIPYYFREKMANLQTNVEYLSNKIREYFDVKEPDTGIIEFLTSFSTYL
jgi:hypothetical protein